MRIRQGVLRAFAVLGVILRLGAGEQFLFQPVSDLVDRLIIDAHGAVELQLGEAERVLGGAAVAHHAFGTAGNIPGTILGQLELGAFGADEGCILLVGIPLITVAGPLAFLLGE